MGRSIIFVVFAFILFSCSQDKKEEMKGNVSDVFPVEKLPKLMNISQNARDVLKDWPEYNALETSIKALYTVKNDEGLSVVIEDLVEKQKLLEASEFPSTYDTPQVKSRLKVFKTYILKVKANMGYGIETLTPLGEMVGAYNAMSDQFMVTVNNTLDTLKLLDE
ncbi:hypothetical protein K8352_08825 [Flavobacteriaceae bacterium F89]|uniref:Uncharacterized protein n=1 Tax=Cerina litoralis TaxID=2874477 RepID=A0AAE3ETH7_9FLAO|nr:hypothetical protein [Cerina litoralis]MCG2460850.1 hypothetical protein [Cerina litoralis]